MIVRETQDQCPVVLSPEDDLAGDGMGRVRVFTGPISFFG